MFRSRYRLDWRVGNKSLTGNSASGLANLPIEYDFSTLPDGALPAAFTGATWTIASGKAVNSVTLGTELLADPGLEATYTAGKCNTFAAAVGSPTLAQSANVHGGSKAQEFTGTANNNEIYWNFITLTAVRWYLQSIWGIRTAGATQTAQVRFARTGAKPQASIDTVIESAAYTQTFNVLRAESTGASTTEIVAIGASDFATIVVDDGSIKEITTSTMLASVDAGASDKIARGAIGAINGIVGIVARLDNTANPQNFIIGYIYRHRGIRYCVLEKCVAGTYTQLIAPVLIGYDFNWVEGRQLEIRCSGSTVSIWYNSTQVGTNQTVSDAGILSNTKFGMISAGGSDLQSFFVVAP